MHSDLIADLIALVGIGLPLALLARRLGMSTLVAYLGAGALAAGIGFIDAADVAILSEVGASLLLFAIGLEMDLFAIKRQLRQILTAAIGQLGSTILLGTLLLVLLGLDWAAAFAIGACLALSSTLVVLRALDEGHLRHRREGQTVLGLLLTQDLCLPLLMIILTLTLPGEAHRPLWLQGLGLIGVLGGTYLVRRYGSRLLDPIFAARMPEIEVAFAVMVAIGAAWLSAHLGLGEAVGAFCAGIALGSDEHRHTVESAIKPFEGLFAILFFTAIGLQFDHVFVLDHLPMVLGALGIAVVLKSLLAGAALRLSGLAWAPAIGCGLMVGQVGEFSFVLASTAHAGGAGVLDEEVFRLIVAVACLSLALTPLLIGLARPLLPRPAHEDIAGRSSAVVVAGLGPVGNTVVNVLHKAGHHLLLVDRNRHLLAPWQDVPHIDCVQGGIENLDSWLPVLGARPRAVILSFPIADTSALVAERLRGNDPELTIIARCPYHSQISILIAAGVQHVICDEDATALALEPILAQALIRKEQTAAYPRTRISTAALHPPKNTSQPDS